MTPGLVDENRDKPTPKQPGQPAGGVTAVPSAKPEQIANPLDAAIAATGQQSNWLDQFLKERNPARALSLWLESNGLSRPSNPKELSRLISRFIAGIDRLVTDQVNAILHHERLQRLEASWRGLRYIVEQADHAENVKIRVLNASWQDLSRDLAQAETLEFDQSQLFRKVYSDEFGMAGGEPFGVILGDYFVGRRRSVEYKINDTKVLQGISQVAAAAFAPFITAAHPNLLGLEDFSQFERPIQAVSLEPKDMDWRTLRDSDDARFVGLTLPRILMRLPYADDGSRADGFRYRENADGPDRSRYLWGNAAFAFGAVLIRTYAECGWLADIRGFDRDVVGRGLVAGLAVQSLPTDKPGVATKFPLETALTDLREKELTELGFIPICHCKDTDLCVFYSNQSVQKPRLYDRAVASTNARMSAMLQYTLCVSRFAHYLKVLARDKIGSFTEGQQLQNFLGNWLMNYVANDTNAGPEQRAKYPLREAEVHVREEPGKPGSYECTMHLLPHSQMDALTVGIRLKTAMAPQGA